MGFGRQARCGTGGVWVQLEDRPDEARGAVGGCLDRGCIGGDGFRPESHGVTPVSSSARAGTNPEYLTHRELRYTRRVLGRRSR